MVNLITEHIDIWTAVQIQKSNGGRGRGANSNGQSVYGIKKLRELILELAVRGKLVPQDPKDEPASVLLEKIAKEKKRLIKEGKIKKEKPLPEISEDEKPFELPEGWEWARLQDVSLYIQRGKSPKYANEGYVHVISQKCVQWSGFDLTLAQFVDDQSISTYQPERFLQFNDLLWNSTGTGTVGRINVLGEIEPNAMVADSHVTVIRPLKLSSNFLWCYVAAPGIQLRINPEHEKSLVTGTTKQVELNNSSVISLAVPIPPLAEQHRIVAKVDELMALCDQLEQQQIESSDTHQILVETLLATLTHAADQKECAKSWQRIANHFDTLFTTEQSIDQLKQTILQLAVMGKLVPQDSNDLPAPRPGKWFVYVLECEDGSLYKGHSQDILKRWKQHASGEGSEWTKKHPPKRLVHWEAFNSQEEAVAREKELKSGYGRKWLEREIKAGRTRQAGLPASVLLKKIAKEKERLIKEGKIKKNKPLPGISEDEKPFELPAGWDVVRFGKIINLISGQHLKPQEYSETKEPKMIPYLTGPAEFGEHYPETTRFTYMRRALASAGDILITCKGSGVGKLNSANTEIAISRQLMSIQPIIADPNYIKLLLQSMNESLRARIVGIAIPGISREDITEAIVKLPPLPEQHRIVAKVDELMAICDALKARLNEAQTTQVQLADAIVEQAVA